ncbi:MAG: 4Fe-4S binding protein [Anaerovoracaceae bacterium]|nr:4Fe-4S binding protein [Anaerovoracaceae bacterium]
MNTVKNILKEESIMAYKIEDSCIACGACEAECPTGAISEGDGIFVIDADTCIDCGACAGVCPTGAPVEA